MNRAAVLDETGSVDAFIRVVPNITEVKIAIIGTFAANGAMTDEQLVEAYNRRRVEFPSIPAASPQSIRSRRAELVRAGVIVATSVVGKSAYGHPMATWALASAERAR